MNVKEIAFAAYPSDDVAATRAWYEEHLGLKFAGAYCEGGIEKYNEAHFPGGAFGLMASKWIGRESGSASSVFFEVEDLDEAAASLRVKGVTVGQLMDTAVCKIVSFVDCDGNIAWLHERKPRV